MMGDGKRRGHEQTVRMAAQHHRGDFVAREPASVFQLGRSTEMSVVSASAWQPIISDIGNGHGCEAK